MRIDYRILWFEDNASSYSTKKAFVKDIVEDYGFNFIEPHNEVDGSNIETIPYSMYDLIIADMSLANGSTGIKLMDAIRKKSVFTEVLFYSSNGEKAVREELAKYDIDGAYCSGRDNDDFEFKVREVIYTLIKKTQDLSNLRGLVMAEVSELDVKMMDIIKKYYVQNETEELKNTFHEHITKKLEERFKKALEGCEKKEKVCYHKWKNEPIESIIPKMEAAQLAKAVNYLISTDLYSPVRANFFEDYKAEIVDTRNQLAHCASKIEDGKEILITRDGDKTYNDESIKEIRKNILKYSEIFTKLLQ